VAKYGGFLYYPSGNALAKVYGGAALPSLSVEPFTALTVDYDQVELSWVNPVGDFRRFRLLRSQEGIPDTEEDGLILYDSATVPSFTTFTDNFMGGRLGLYFKCVNRLSPGDYFSNQTLFLVG
jgi:hypothetical protein